MKKLSIISGLLILLSVACRGPLAKQESTEAAGRNTVETSTAAGAAHMQEAKTGKEEITIEPAQGGITIAELFANMKKYSGKAVKIRGKVTKVNPSIMDKNWIHLQDGTSFEEQFDLTITSDFVPEVGSIITVEGKISLDKDFGYGYSYAILMEEGKLVTIQ